MKTDPKTLHRAINADLVALNAIDFETLATQLHTIIDTTTGNHHLRQWETPIDTEPDGYPTTSSGSDAGGAHTTNTSTSVERAADARTRHRDPIDQLITRALHNLADTVNNARGLAGALAELDTIRTNKPATGPAAGCWALNRVGGWEPIHATINIDGQPYALGRWAYDYQRRLGTLPPLIHCRAHIEGRKVFVKP